MPVHLNNTEQVGFNEQFCDNHKVSYYQVWLYMILSTMKVDILKWKERQNAKF